MIESRYEDVCIRGAAGDSERTPLSCLTASSVADFYKPSHPAPSIVTPKGLGGGSLFVPHLFTPATALPPPSPLVPRSPTPPRGRAVSHSPCPKMVLSPAPISSRNVDFQPRVEVVFFAQEEDSPSERPDRREGLVKQFDGRSEIMRGRIGSEDIEQYLSLMSLSSAQIGVQEDDEEDGWGCHVGGGSAGGRSRRARSYANQWDDLSAIVGRGRKEEGDGSCDDGTESTTSEDSQVGLWLMENMPCDCDL